MTNATAPRISRAAQRILDLAADDPQLQQLMPDPVVLEQITRPGQSVESIVTTILTGYADRPALGERRYEVVEEDGRQVRRTLPEFATITYGELDRRVRAVAGAWQQDEPGVRPGEFVCFLGFAGTDYVTVDLATVLVRGVAVPLQSTLGDADLDRIVGDTAPVIIAATISDLPLAGRLAGRHRSVRSLLVLDYDPRIDDDRDLMSAALRELAAGSCDIPVVVLAEVVASARSWTPSADPADPERIALLVHSSGSTGTPKGAIITERHAVFQYTVMPPVPLPTVRLCFAPLNHFMGRGAVTNTLARGGTVYFTARTDMSTLFEDFALVRPTEAVVFPRVLEMIYRRFLADVARRSAAASGVDREEIREQVMGEMRYTVLGDRIASIFGGAAPTTPELRAFVTACFPVGYAEGYGTTEAGGSVTVRDRVNRAEVLDYKLRDVPELGYTTADKPYPRGELLVKTRLAIPGYFKNPEATAALFDEDGYVCTGDVMEERGPDHLVYVDRRNDVIKLAHGEFVTLGAVGTAFETHSDVIRQIFVHGSSARAYLVAVVVPDAEVVSVRLGPDATPDALRGLIRSELVTAARGARLRSFEIPRDFLVEDEPFSQANGMLSSVSKRLRPKLLDRYGPRLDQLYADLERRQNDDLLALRGDSSGLSVLDKVCRALAATLGVEEVDGTEQRSFTDLGGDSLGASAFAALLSDVFDVDVPVNAVLSPAGSPAAWARQIEESLRPGAARPTASSVHHGDTRVLNARDLDAAVLLPADVVAAPATVDAPAASRAVLVTGATGFLGRFLLLEWLERVAPGGGTVTALVRARSEDEARARLQAAYATDDELAGRFAELEPHLDVVVGDVAQHRLGLDDATWDRLATGLDRVVHPAALVNHVLEYEYLFGPNVLGTAELVALCLTGTRKRFDFVSSLAVVPYLEPGSLADESTPLRPAVTVPDRYSAHYGASKWAAEHVLHSAHERFGLPVTIFRGDMMLPHRRFRGQLNVPDIFVRLLYSVVASGLAPESFYEPRPDGHRTRAHFDGLPVDFIAAAATWIGGVDDTSLRTFHVVNAHDDGVSLDSVVDWIAEAGRPIERVTGYAEWLARFEGALRNLSDDARQRSSLPVLASLQRPARAGLDAVGCARFEEAVSLVPGEPQVPHITADLVRKCLADLVFAGLIPA